MSKILLGAAVVAAAALSAPSAYAIGGGPTPYWASPWYSGNGPSPAVERRSAFTGEYGAVDSHDEVTHARRADHGHRHALTQ
jgi:hypothetical protein